MNLIYVEKINSTNEYAKKYCLNYFHHNKNKNWIIISSGYQTNGLGTRGNFWYSTNNKNLICSIIIFHTNKNFYIKRKYIINVIISNAIHKVLKKISNKKFFWIKWPNDIFIENKKIGGILIENYVFFNTINTSIIGIGLNINQIEFDDKLNATSLKKIFKNNFKIKNIFFDIIFSIQTEYLYFIKYGEKLIRKYYIKNLYLKNKKSLFYICKIKNIIYGIIRSVNKQGLLILEIKNKLYFFHQKDIIFIF
ncbi:biotin--[acetyl-CoA-carboxylase] ligase [Blattabacterium cuenoti]|uniref:biotin--[acetyl-CoA-carboxylase] ligase n=1 Tax=Blattabacterium cuenoti TaxID=1653831 RepID=UPI001EEC54DF|nr:biotin--[acetyl-CoA-carboxylase] ligase [Blattabacterium cuenoti]